MGTRGCVGKAIVERCEHRKDELIPARIGGGREHDLLRARAAPRNRASPTRDRTRTKHRDRRDPIAERGLMRRRLRRGRRYVTPLFKCVSHTFTNAILKQGRGERERVRSPSSYAENNLC
jgi:hypothetical protein